MQNNTQEVNKQTREDILFYFEEKKRLTNRHYKYVPASKYDLYLDEAALLCDHFKQHAATYVHLMYDRLGGKKEFFNPEHLRGKQVKFFLEETLDPENNSSYEIEITNNNIEYSELWAQQHNLAMRYIEQGEDVESVLIDSGIKFFAWFRILATPNRCPAIIDKYKKIAKKEVTPGLLKFIQSENLDGDRLL